MATGTKVTVNLHTNGSNPGGFVFDGLSVSTFVYDASASGNFNNPAAIPSNSAGFVNVTPPGNATIGEGAIVCHVEINDYPSDHSDAYIVDLLYTSTVTPNMASQLIQIVALAEQAVGTVIAAYVASPQGAAAIGGGSPTVSPTVLLSSTPI
jgi:hypothetical protein